MKSQLPPCSAHTTTTLAGIRPVSAPRAAPTARTCQSQTHRQRGRARGAGGRSGASCQAPPGSGSPAASTSRRRRSNNRPAAASSDRVCQAGTPGSPSIRPSSQHSGAPSSSRSGATKRKPGHALPTFTARKHRRANLVEQCGVAARAAPPRSPCDSDNDKVGVDDSLSARHPDHASGATTATAAAAVEGTMGGEDEAKGAADTPAEGRRRVISIGEEVVAVCDWLSAVVGLHSRPDIKRAPPGLGPAPSYAEQLTMSPQQLTVLARTYKTCVRRVRRHRSHQRLAPVPQRGGARAVPSCTQLGGQQRRPRRGSGRA